MLKKLQITNFQKHTDLEIEFKEDGVTVLHGASEVGKSCIRRAIEFVCEHQTFKGQRRVDTKKTSVKAWLTDNRTVERIISNSINRYIIKKGESEQVFDSVGKTAPSEVREFIGIYPIDLDGEEIYLNSYPQIGKPFLFDQSPSSRMKLFNKLTGNDVLDRLFTEFNKDILRIKRNIREETETFTDRIDIIHKKKTEMEKAVAIHDRLKKRVINLKTKYEKYSKLLQLKELMESNFGKQKNMLDILKGLNIPEDDILQGVTEKIDRFTKLLTHRNDTEKVEIQLNRVRGQLKDMKPLSIELGDLKGKIERFEGIEGVYEKFSQNQVLLQSFRKKLKVLDMDIKHGSEKLKKYKICPTCEQEIK